MQLKQAGYEVSVLARAYQAQDVVCQCRCPASVDPEAEGEAGPAGVVLVVARFGQVITHTQAANLGDSHTSAEARQQKCSVPVAVLGAADFSNRTACSSC